MYDVKRNPQPHLNIHRSILLILFSLAACLPFATRAQAKGAGDTISINIKDDLQHESLSRVLADVKSLKEGKVGEIIGKFSGRDNRWVWKVREGNLPLNTNAITEVKPYGVVTTLNYSILKGATKLSVARTLIHEMIHAYLVLYFRHDSTANATYPRMVAAYRAQIPAPQLNDVHHQEMAASFVDEIALALREYGRTLGLKVADSVYTDLAWGGLDFQNNNQLAEENKERIRQRLQSEQRGVLVYPVSPAGPPMSD